jgi:serine/threonine protein kinase
MPQLFDNRYFFVKDLGIGGFGKVFLANEEKSNHLVAIKQLKNQNKDNQQNIIHEMQMIAKFNHPNIIAYKHNFIQDELLYIVMEYCPLGSLSELIHKGNISETFVWKWLETLAETLQFVHEKQIIHHDIKPDNILFTEDRCIKISDFGIANTGAGTKAYMSPESLNWKTNSVKDERVDIYALGVTLMEMLTRKNPFLYKSADEILEIHDKKEFGISHLPNWQQEIILKAIAKIPEQRFQSMKEFKEAIQSKYVPIIFDKEVIKAGDIAQKANILLKNKKWSKAINLLDYAENQLRPNVNILQLKGKYFLLQQQLQSAKKYYDKALKWNPRLDVQKELGWIHLEMKDYPTAISLLSDHLHRNPSDYEAYNLLLQCFYETNRYEIAMDLARTLLSIDVYNLCFANNYYISCVMHNIGKTIFPDTVLKADKFENHFLNYNYSIVLEAESSHNFEKKPTLKSKLLFMNYRFNKFNSGTLYMEDNIKDTIEITKPIIKFGRDNFPGNDIKVPGGTKISRRHCLIINAKDDAWLYDLDSTGTYINNEKVVEKIPLIGKNTIYIGKSEYILTNDKNKLF